MSNSPPKGVGKSLSTGRKILYSLILLSFFLLVAIAAGEMYVRRCCSELYTKPSPAPPYDTAQKDGLLGWKMTPGYTFEGKMRDAGGQEYDLSLRYDENGFKAFGDTAAARPKVFFIGDSYTASIEVSNEKSFFNLLKDSLDVEVFAYGHAGYGTLQQYMVFDQWVDRIRPDIVVWEVCSNDFIDNYAPLEIVCGYKVGERRPYLSPKGKVFYRRPLSVWQKMQEHAMFFKWLEERWEVAQEKMFGKIPRVGEHYISVEKRAFAPFDQSVKTTEKIVEMIKARLPEGVQLVGFSADIYQPQLEEFRRIFESNGFPFFDGPALDVEKAAVEQKRVVRAADGYHWNEQGHEIVAGSLLPVLLPLIKR